jgi:hypothetical protein
MARAREVRRANAHAERVTKLFGALTRRAGHAHARRTLERATGVEQLSKLPVAKWQAAAVALGREVEAVRVGDRALALVRSRLEDDADDALTTKARHIVRVQLAEFADRAIADAIKRYEGAADAIEANRCADEEALKAANKQAAAENLRVREGGLFVVDADVTLPWLLVWRANNHAYDEDWRQRDHVTIDDGGESISIAFEIGGKIGTATYVAKSDAMRFHFDGHDFAVPHRALIDAFAIAESRKWFSWDWRDEPIDAHRYGDNAGNFVTR